MRVFGRTILVVGATLTLAPVWSIPGGRPALGQESGGGALTVDEVIDMVRVSGPKLSPDGSRILFTRSELDWDENKRESRIWVVGPDGEGMRPFTGSTDDRSPEWSPDGRWVSFTRPVGEGDRVRQLFVLPTDGGEAIQLTTHGTAVGRYRWSEDSGSIFFLSSDSLPDETEKERKKGDDAVFIDEGPNGQTRGNWNGVWIVRVDVEDAPVQASRLTAEGRIVGDFTPSPDGNHLAYNYRTENRRNAGHLSEIVILSTTTGDEERVTDNDAPESQLAWSPDGASITFVAPDLESWELDQGNLYLHDIPTGETRQLMAGIDADMRSYHWTSGGRFIDIVALDRTDANLYRLDVRSDELEQLTDLPGVVSGASFDRFHDKAAIQFASPSEPGDLWLVEMGDGSRTRLTTANPRLEGRRLAEPEIIRWDSSDGLEIEGLLYTPEERVAPGAAVLEIHGGPAGVFTRGFDADAQLLVAHGYAVLQPNVRGSSGYGDALLRGNMNDIGGGDFQDLMTGVDAIIDRGVADGGLARREGMELRRDPRRLDDHTHRTVQGGEPRCDGRRLEERVRGGLQFRRGALVPGRRSLVEPGLLDRAFGVHAPGPGEDPYDPLPRGQRPHRHDGAVDELLRGAPAPGGRSAVHPVPARGTRHPGAAAPAHADDRGDALASPLREGTGGLGAAGAPRRDRRQAGCAHFVSGPAGVAAAVIPQQVIARKRDGERLSSGELTGFLEAYMDHRVGDDQMAAFLMAVHFNGMSPRELDVLVEVMLHSGEVIEPGAGWPGPRVDKHSTGGVGDKVSLALAPLAAEMGMVVPMMSGRGLGHTGGTLDKLESIPGFRTGISLEEFDRVLRSTGCAMIGQTDEIAPLDRRLYALRDVTATVPSLPLITASIMSKKLAEGLDGLVLDVKVGRGAFMARIEDARALASAMTAVGSARGIAVTAVLTAMDRPLGRAIGNTLEVREAVACLAGGGPDSLRALCIELAAEMALAGKLVSSVSEGRSRAEDALAGGGPVERFVRLAAEQGGRLRPDRDGYGLPAAPFTETVVADRDGCITAVDPLTLGYGVIALGGGRRRQDDAIDPTVGFELAVEVGSPISRGDALASVYARNRSDLAVGARVVRDAVTIGAEADSDPLPQVLERVRSTDEGRAPES